MTAIVTLLSVAAGGVAYAAVSTSPVVLAPGQGRLHCDGSKLTFAKAAAGAVDRSYTCTASSTTTSSTTTTSTTTTATTAVTTAVPVAPAGSAPLDPLFAYKFELPDTLLTNEYAYWNPLATDARISPDWELTSGSLFVRADQGWTGVPDNVGPNATSSNGNNSSVFRLTTRRADFGDVQVAFDLLNSKLSSTSSTPAVDWDGVHIFLRYQSEESLYYASVNRRDGSVVLKKKCAGGPSNGGTYYDLKNAQGVAYVSGHPIPFGAVQHVSASIKTNADGSVTLSLAQNGTTLATATDSGIGCAAITHGGKVGIRGDNDDFSFDNFSVTGV